MNKKLYAILVLAFISSGMQAMQQQRTKAQLSNHRKVPFMITTITSRGPLVEHVYPGKTITKENDKEIFIAGEGANYKLLFNGNGTASLFVLHDGNATRLTEVSGHDVSLVLNNKGGIDLQQKGIRIEIKPDTGASEGTLSFGNISM